MSDLRVSEHGRTYEAQIKTFLPTWLNHWTVTEGTSTWCQCIWVSPLRQLSKTDQTTLRKMWPSHIAASQTVEAWNWSLLISFCNSRNQLISLGFFFIQRVFCWGNYPTLILIQGLCLETTSSVNHRKDRVTDSLGSLLVSGIPDPQPAR